MNVEGLVWWLEGWMLEGLIVGDGVGVFLVYYLSKWREV